MPAITKLDGLTRSVTPDPLHPFRAVGQVTLARIVEHLLELA